MLNFKELLLWISNFARGKMVTCRSKGNDQKFEAREPTHFQWGLSYNW